MPRLRRYTWSAATAALLLAGLTACSSASQAGSPTPATPATPATTTTASPASSSASPSATASPTSETPSPSPTAPEPTRAQKLPDSCGLLSEAEVAAINGAGGAPVRDGGSDTAAFSIDGCHFGNIKDGLVSIQIVRPADGPNPVTGTLGSGGTSVAGLPSGRGFPVGTMLGGFGPGHTVTAVSGDVLLAVSLLSNAPVTEAQEASLAAAVSAAIARL